MFTENPQEFILPSVMDDEGCLNIFSPSGPVLKNSNSYIF